jgi:antitoxin component YwqK of YwqJK toxin-antitoxin module
MKVFSILFVASTLIFNTLLGQKINKTDRQGRRQGYWKIYIPAFPSELPANSNEGFYYNNKLIGVWQEKTAEGKVFEEDIYFDTLESRIQEIKYYLNGNVQSIGFLLASYHLDTIRYVDPTVNKEKVAITKTWLLREGKWSFYYKSGILQSEGNYKSDNKIGKWNHYNEKGELDKSEEEPNK